jgi:hypothetical protein
MESESIAKRAVQEACELATAEVLKKHPIRGDTWLKTLTMDSMGRLSMNKIGRVIYMYGASDIAQMEGRDVNYADEIQDELVDIISFASFQLWMLRHKEGKMV